MAKIYELNFDGDPLEEVFEFLAKLQKNRSHEEIRRLYLNIAATCVNSVVFATLHDKLLELDSILAEMKVETLEKLSIFNAS